MTKKTAILMLLGVIFYLRVCQLAASLNMSHTDKSSLLALKALLNSDILARNWSQETSFCTWIGITCSPRHLRVTGLDLSGMVLQGSIAREIGNLSFLTSLNINKNNIRGHIPGEIGNLRRLRVLDMARNQLSDHIPQSLGLLTKLEYLSLSNNYLSGDIPGSVSTCLELNFLDLSYNNLTGNIPARIGNLSQLQTLNLMGNQLTGEVNSTIFNISSLLYFVVGDNHLSGSIPEHICSQSSKLEALVLDFNEFEGGFPSAVIHCHSLKRISLVHNKFTGNIPSEFWNLSAMQWVSLSRNKFTGIIPPSIGNLTNLMVFTIADNSFYGSIPSEMGQLSSLTYLGLGMNKLKGEVSHSMFNLSWLQEFSLEENNLSGNLPFSIDKGLPNIEGIFISHNQFHGKIPNSISNLSKLTVLELADNSLTGHIPITFGRLHQLQWLNLARNQFTNNISMPEQDFLSSLTVCKYLEFIQVSSNPMTGVLPKSLGTGNLSASLETFLVNSCQIRSSLPNEIGNFNNLMWLDLGSNELTGAIPETLRNLRNLQKLGMERNTFHGHIPLVICNLGNLYSINLAENNFSGQLPSCLRKLSLLKEINMAGNALNFTIPSTLWFDEHIERINFSYNFLHGSIPGEIGNMKGLIELDLSRNQLIGEIPSPISHLHNLINLSLSSNKLDGPIIDSLSNLMDLQYLDLSHNHFSGPIPTSLNKLTNLNYFNVSFNELSGEIPDAGPFLNFTAEFFAGNKGLCGVPRFKVGACRRSASIKNKLLKYILSVLALVVVAAVILILFLRCRGRKLSPSSLFDSPLVFMYKRISYNAILHATNNLDEENLIGRGSFGCVYKGNFSDAMVAAVKVFNLDVQGALKSFDTECKILRSIRHRNLVKVITSCSNLDFKALVMTYMPKGNLEKWLYSPNCSLNIIQRLGIMIDVASAVYYLHEGYTFPIVHCDLKPNNILLDEEMFAHVGDFGIAKLLTLEQRVQQTRTLGTIGYIAPEYGSEGLVSTMVDVYSYGILLMEVFSRRKPTYEMFTGELTMRRWVFESFPNSVMQVVDQELLNMDDQSNRAKLESCLTSTIELALECTADLPEERPNMKDVLARTNMIKLNFSSNDSFLREQFE